MSDRIESESISRRDYLGLAGALGLPKSHNLGDVLKELLLGSSEPGQHSLIRFYTLHCIFLPVLTTMGSFSQRAILNEADLAPAILSERVTNGRSRY